MPSQLSGKMGGKNNNLNKLVQSDKCFSIILGTTFAHKYVRMQQKPIKNLSNKNLCYNLNLNGNTKELSYCKNLPKMLL